MKVINLIGAANTGKSTNVYGLLYAMKKLGLKVEYADEYAKMLTWELRDNVLSDQLYILAKQNRKLSRLTHLDYVVMDTSLLLGIVYARNPLPELVSIIKAYFNLYDNVTFYLPRNECYGFQSEGRVQASSEEADAFIPLIESVLPENTIRLPKVKEEGEDYVLPILDHLGLGEQARKLKMWW